ncbi:VOC family protein [Streptomyces sp. 8L]|uniref:VOC family protein n=1 Tax=Streptomyces sp. 8L TaxID=2877242 RepID=UPI001CD51F0B|nr:VOC family protein [Streptomyces sp. 8L]MCA1220799.1 VOC family protein [Streptomyces sp. 8L]
MSPIAVDITVRQVFFEMGNGELFSLYEAPGVVDKPAAPVSSVLWPSVKAELCSRPDVPQKLDHLSFDVPTHADLEWFRERLVAYGVPVSEISERRGEHNTHRFISSFYFFDPSGNPLELASFDVSDTAWKSYDFTDWFMDEEPVPALLDDSADGSAALPPHWIGSSEA